MSKFIEKSSERYIFHFFADSVAEKDIEKIIEKQELAYKKIVSFLSVDNNRKINYFLYPSNEIKNEMTGNDGNGHADREKFEVHAVYSDEIKCIGPHEDTHLLSDVLGLPPQLFREGLAEYLSGSWDGKSHEELSKELLANKQLPDMTDLIDDEKWYEIPDQVSYPTAGAFVIYLINKFGKEKFLEIYSKLNRDFGASKNRKLFTEILGEEIQNSQAQWIGELKD